MIKIGFQILLFLIIFFNYNALANGTESYHQTQNEDNLFNKKIKSKLVFEKFLLNRKKNITEKELIKKKSKYYSRFFNGVLYFSDRNNLPKDWYETAKKEKYNKYIKVLSKFYNLLTDEDEKILSFRCINDLGFYNKISFLDKITYDFKNPYNAKNAKEEDLCKISLDKLAFLSKVICASNDEKKIAKNKSILNSLLSNVNLLEELFHYRENMVKNENFLLHYDDVGSLLVNSGLPEGEYENIFLPKDFDYVFKEKYLEDENSDNIGEIKKEIFNCFPNVTIQEKNENLTSNKYNALYLLFKFLFKANIVKFLYRWKLYNLLWYIIFGGFYVMIVKILFFKKKISTTKWYILLAILIYVLFIKNHVPILRSFFDKIYDNKILSIVIVLNILILKKIIETIIKSGSFSLKPIILVIRNFTNTIKPTATGIIKENIIPIIIIISLFGLLATIIYLNSLNFSKMTEYLCNVLYVKNITCIQNYIKSLMNFYLTIKNNENLYQFFKEDFKESSRIFDVEYKLNNNLDKHQKQFFELLFKKKTLNKDEIIKFYAFLYKTKDILIKLIIESINVGVYINSAMLVKSGCFCIADFCKGQNYIKMDDFLHPYLINGVKNSFEIGEKSKYKFRNMVFTGSNGTGKTTFQTAIITNILLAQSLGIAFCKKYVSTVYDKIISIFNSETNISEGRSLYKEEVYTIRNLLLFLKNNKNMKILLCLDEPLSSTDPETANELVTMIFKKTFSYPNVTNLVATHFNSPQEIEKDNNLKAKNFRFAIDYNENEIKNHYKLEQGIGKRIGKKIAIEYGILDLIKT